MKITITIEDSTPWYAPFSSQEACLEHQRRKNRRENLIWNEHELDGEPRFNPKFKDLLDAFLKQSKAKL